MITTELKSQIEQKIIPYWKNLRDDSYGGYYGLVDFDLQVDHKAVKGCILNSRILWFFSSAYLLLRDPSLLNEAQHAYEFLQCTFLDRQYGGVYWSATCDGKIEDGTKHTYNQAFAVYALSAFYQASGQKEALDTAFQLFDRIEQTCTDSYGYLEAFDHDWKPKSNEKLSENGLLADKTMNTLLHVLEAYTELYRVSQAEQVRQCLVRILHIFHEKVYNPEKCQLEVFFNEKMHTISDLNSYGHDIEASWLLDRACEVLGDVALTEETLQYTTCLAEAVSQRAIDHGAMNNECFHGVVDTTRVWWVQAEAMVGFYQMFQKTGEERYKVRTEQLWEYIKKYVIDPRSGSEWFWDVNRDGQPVSRKPITEPWKCPYHNGRMCMELIRRTNE